MLRAQSIIVFMVVAGLSCGEPAVANDSALHRLHSTVLSAVEQSPALAAEQWRIEADAASGRADLAPGTPNLEVQREGLGGGLSHQPNSASYLRVARELPFPWLLREARGARQLTTRFAQMASDAVAVSTAATAAQRWLDLAAASEQLALLERRRDRIAQAVRIQETRFRVGEVAGSDLLQLRLELSTVRAEHAAARRAVEAMRAELELLCGQRCMPPVVGDLASLSSRQEVQSSSLPSTAALQQALSWQLVAHDLELARTRSQISRVEAWGRPEAELEWEHVPSLGGEPSFDALGVRVSVPLPVGTAGRQTRAAADATVRASELDAEARQQRLTNQLSRTVASITVARDSLRELEDVLANAVDAERSLAEQFRLGTMTYLSYIDGLSRLDAARSAAVDTRLELLVRHIQLYELLGDLAPVSLPVSVEDAR